MPAKLTTKKFIERACVVHNSYYNYDSVVYQSAHEKITIYCYVHGVFEQTPSAHLSGRGCSLCSNNKKKTTEDFIEKARKVHGNKYGYAFSVYKSATCKIMVYCYEHGMFEQESSSHLKGIGCPGCAKTGFDRTKVGFLYILRSDCGRYMKIGITHNPKQRHTELSRETPFHFECIELIEGSGGQIAELEKELLAKYQPAGFDNQFDGYSEWRLWDDSIRGQLVC